MRIKSLIRIFNEKKLNGAALYIAVILGIVIGVMLTLFILLSRYNQRHITVHAQWSQLYCNINSAFEMAKSGYLTSEMNNRWIKNIYSDDSIRIKKLNWGAYQIILAETKNRHHRLAKAGLFGTVMTPDTALLVADQGRPVGVSGKIIFKAPCFLPKAGIKPAYIEGMSYQADGSNSVWMRPAPMAIPELSETFLKSLEEQRETTLSNDSLMSYTGSSVSHPFSEKTLVYQFSGRDLRQHHLQGNVKIMTEGELVIDSTNHLDDIVMICKKVRFKEGFRGRVHVLASDSIVIEKNCDFLYPSSFALTGDAADPGLKCIRFDEDCRFSGGIVAYQRTVSGSGGEVFIQLHATSEVNGLVYSSGFVHVQGKVNGTVIGNKLLIKSSSAVYENHLLACELNPSRYAHILAVPGLFKKNNILKCGKKL